MSTRNPSIRKITISLPEDLVVFAEHEATRWGLNRSQVISRVLAQVKHSEETRLAAEGYQFYSQESSEFAESSSQAVKEALNHDG